jgi:hypothetical protein
MILLYSSFNEKSSADYFHNQSFINDQGFSFVPMKIRLI